MFVPSLSWQNDQFCIERVKKTPMSYLTVSRSRASFGAGRINSGTRSDVSSRFIIDHMFASPRFWAWSAVSTIAVLSSAPTACGNETLRFNRACPEPVLTNGIVVLF